MMMMVLFERQILSGELERECATGDDPRWK
jgi:hypothetical protein